MEVATDFATCSVCFDEFSTEEDCLPRLLACGHSFCTSCLHSLARTRSSTAARRANKSTKKEQSLECPRCRGVTSLGDQGVEGLVRNFDLIALLSHLSHGAGGAGESSEAPNDKSEVRAELNKVKAAMRELDETAARERALETEQAKRGCKTRQKLRDFFGQLKEAVKKRQLELEEELDQMERERCDEGKARDTELGFARQKLEALAEDLLEKMANNSHISAPALISQQVDAECAAARTLLAGGGDRGTEGAIKRCGKVVYLNQSSAEEGLSSGLALEELLRSWGKMERIQQLIRPIRTNSSSTSWSGGDGGSDPSPVQELQLSLGSPGSESGQFQHPWGVALNATGNVIVADSHNHRLQVWSTDGQFVHALGCKGSAPGQLLQPSGVAVDPSSGNIVIADEFNHRIQVWNAEGRFIIEFGSHGSKPGQFDFPRGISVDNGGNIIVADEFNHRVQLFSSDGKLVTTFGYPGSGPGKFLYPSGLALDNHGNIVVTDRNNGRVHVWTPDGRFLRLIGSQGSSPGQLLQPQGVAIDAAGNIIVADYSNHRLQAWGEDGSFLRSFGSQGSLLGQFSHPSGVAVDIVGNIYVTEWDNHRVQVLSNFIN